LLFGLIQVSEFMSMISVVAVNIIIFVDSENISFEARLVA
jgi:hypothetical protein